MGSEGPEDIWSNCQISLLGDDVGCDNWATNTGRESSTPWGGHVQVDMPGSLLTDGD